MKKILLLTGLVLISCLNSIAQGTQSSPSKEETQQWISQKILQFGLDLKDTKHTYKLTFMDDFLIIDHTTTMISVNGNSGLHAIKMIPIKKIQSIYFSEKTSSYWLTIALKNNEAAISVTYDGLPKKMYSSTDFILSKSIDSDNMKDRLSKALNHLVELYGGTPTKEVF